MSLIYPNIVPQNNLRLPDALTVKHGPARLLSRFVLEADKAARHAGLRLRLRHDFDELAYVNKQRIARGDWYRLPIMFDPEYSDLCPENSYWISGEDENNEIVLTHAGRVYYWPETNLAEQACAVFYEDQENHGWQVTTPTAPLVSGVTMTGGCTWVRSDYRGRQLSRLLPRIGRAYALSRWPLDWMFGFVSRGLVAKGIPAGYGYKHTSFSILFPGSPWGDLDFALVTVSPSEAYADFAETLSSGFLATPLPTVSSSGSRMFLPNSVTKTSEEGVRQGSSSLS
jgi:hypothetical protein